jgi:hypothetical protein
VTRWACARWRSGILDLIFERVMGGDFGIWSASGKIRPGRRGDRGGILDVGLGALAVGFGVRRSLSVVRCRFWSSRRWRAVTVYSREKTNLARFPTRHGPQPPENEPGPFSDP